MGHGAHLCGRAAAELNVESEKLKVRTHVDATILTRNTSDLQFEFTPIVGQSFDRLADHFEHPRDHILGLLVILEPFPIKTFEVDRQSVAAVDWGYPRLVDRERGRSEK